MCCGVNVVAIILSPSGGEPSAIGHGWKGRRRWWRPVGGQEWRWWRGRREERGQVVEESAAPLIAAFIKYCRVIYSTTLKTL